MTTITTTSSADSLSGKGGHFFRSVSLFGCVAWFALFYRPTSALCWSPSTISFWPFGTTTVNMSFGRPAYIADSLILWFSCFFFFFFSQNKNFVLNKLPKLYKIFVQKQSITCVKKKICMYM